MTGSDRGLGISGHQRLDALVVRTAEAHPDAVAVEAADASCSYQALVGRAMEAARVLSGGSSPVGLVAERSSWTYVWYLAILMSGRAVVPVSGEMADRDAVSLALAGCDVLVRPNHTPAVEKVEPAHPSDPRIEEAAYVLFTSGTTGRPKGVPISHSHVLSYLSHCLPLLDLTPGSRLSHNFALTFDLSVHDMFCSWSTGSTLVVPTRGEALWPPAYVERRAVTHWFSVPSVVDTATRMRELAPGSMSGLRVSAFCGERLLQSQARSWQGAAPTSKLINLYGPTELTIACSAYVLPQDPSSWPETPNGTVPIGWPFAGSEWMILGDRSDGSGELAVRGEQRFHGYVDARDDTAAFLSAGVGSHPGVSEDDWYLTGDIVTELPDGSLLHLGRRDRQVKVRGFRVELGEVEHVLRVTYGLTEVAAWHDHLGHEVVILAAVVAHEEEVNRIDLRKMPGHLRPARVYAVDALPLNSNRKVDHASLAERFRRHESAGSP